VLQFKKNYFFEKTHIPVNASSYINIPLKTFFGIEICKSQKTYCISILFEINIFYKKFKYRYQCRLYKHLQSNKGGLIGSYDSTMGYERENFSFSLSRNFFYINALIPLLI